MGIYKVVSEFQDKRIEMPGIVLLLNEINSTKLQTTKNETSSGLHKIIL